MPAAWGLVAHLTPGSQAREGASWWQQVMGFLRPLGVFAVLCEGEATGVQQCHLPEITGMGGPLCFTCPGQWTEPALFSFPCLS